MSFAMQEVCVIFIVAEVESNTERFKVVSTLRFGFCIVFRFTVDFMPRVGCVGEPRLIRRLGESRRPPVDASRDNARSWPRNCHHGR